ncbi:MAG: GspH/FimT family pseudopilin [Tatlockia sp.]|nr:GspH/FimT family pseudopilin [Tatlockia sp.]
MLENRGFSLIELVVGLLIVSILFFFALPFSLSMMQKNQLEVVKNEIISAIHFAKTTSVLRGLPLVLAPLPQADNWSAGMLLYVDNDKHEFNEKSELIYEWHWKHPGINVSWQGLYTKNYLLFSTTLQSRALSGHFIISNKQGNRVQLIVNRLGRIRTA